MKSFASEPLVVISDIHGNIDALDAVLAEIDSFLLSPELFVAGDMLLGGADPQAVWTTLTRRNARCVRGLSESALSQIKPQQLTVDTEEKKRKHQLFVDTLDAIGELAVERLRRLPEHLRLPLMDGRELLVVHGSPSDPTQEMSVDMSDEELNALLADDPADIVLCGASHVPFHRQLDEVDLVNVGSVGQAPEGRIAHYTVITPRMNGALIDQRFVEY